MNISRTGVLFKEAQDLAPKTILEMRVTLPLEITGIASTKIICSGPVVRTEVPDAQDKHSAMAAAILSYRFSRD